ncbi:LD-carboxypeptidase [Paenibacillus sp. MMS20-IR301]|uniref:S66 family peptidase n=1 Tax=Paenibacillus sp. MMS20-IR301 TaxID=2895946 RepID=UPI0028EF4013|nr:LD-carboxypeptidase [Paenibacillus sp. MMS20-IR301]WNS41939.1 LD-carboxypeptidase [Paenibacillus sp. MMS20-IR301]
MIRYPILEAGAVIGVTAPSSGVGEELRELLELACQRMRSEGYGVVYGATAWTQDKAKSAPASVRAAEFNAMMADDSIGLVIPPWGGELLIEIMEQVDFGGITPKWIVGYSDISVLLLAVTLRTGIATAHGTNFVDLRGPETDPTTAMWEKVLSTASGGSVVQHSSQQYQLEWGAEPSPHVFTLTEPTSWKTVGNKNVTMQGRLLGGCIDVIRHLIGTPYGDVRHFRQHYIGNEPILWYLENCELQVADLRRSLVQMKLAGWFEHCSGLMFGRSAANRPMENYTVEDVYQELAEELQLPVVYDIDCGHLPPQITLINGAFAEVQVEVGSKAGENKALHEGEGKEIGLIRQYFRS